jgi:hypothetical protein
MQITTDRSSKLTDVMIWRAGFAEEREVLVSVVDHFDFSAATSARAELGHSLTERLTAGCLEKHLATLAAWIGKCKREEEGYHHVLYCCWPN